MLKKAVCPECGSSNIRVKQFIRLDLPITDAQKEIDKDIINKETTTVIDDNDSPITIVYCEDCYHEISRDVDLGVMFKAKDLTDELCKRVEELEQFRTDTFAKEFREEIEAHDFSDQYHKLEGLRGNIYKDEYEIREGESTDELIERLFGSGTPEDESLSEDTEEEESDSLGIVWDESEE